MKKMSTIKFPNQTEAYEIVDATARLSIDNKTDIGHTHTVSEITDFAHEHDERYYTELETDAKLDELKTLIGENANAIEILEETYAAIPEPVQSDLSQNDSTAPDYVKNRTHWIQHAETLLDSEVFECTTLTEDSESYYCAKSGNIGLVDGNKYNVTVDGTTYTASALTAFGTNDIALIAEIDKCRIYDRENGVVEVFTNSSATLTISIEDAEDIYVKLDEKFIPDVFARSTDIELKMNKENPTGSGALSINRASGSEIGENSVAIGSDCIASGASAIAIGSGVSATGFASHAEGTGTVASGNLAHAEGQDSKATGYASHAESSGEANGDYSHAEGYGIADGNYSHASGNGTWAVGRSQTVIGEANLEDSATDAATRGTYAVIVGNGDMDAGEYSNAATMDWEGNVWFAGDVYVGSTSGTNKDEGSKILATKPSMTRITLSPTSWDATALTQSVTVTGISADETAQIIQCSPYGASMSAAVESGIYCSGQAADTLTFTCNSVPTEDVQFAVSWQDCVWIEPPIIQLDTANFNDYFDKEVSSGYFLYDGSSFCLKYTEIETTSNGDSGIAPAVLETNITSVLLTAKKDMKISFDYEFNMNPNLSEGISTAVVVREMGATISVLHVDGGETYIFNDYTIVTGNGSWSGELVAGDALELMMRTTNSETDALYVKLSDIVVE